ncbi:NUDIX hydrolase domain-like protein [Cristinia sonorae]|uniref:NUDIX hydrolase domain-like protein n=1 Tax=Cristinia sonorae TaxID=1940300 RepID=A0A8K0UJV6_9AGAR|nr:NUDIX hydrolase domain-like protein [Cristinia sonorae]
MKLFGPERKGLLKFHRPLDENYSLTNLKSESRLCLTNLANYAAPKTNLRFPKSRSAAVLVALFIGRSGDLHVLLSRRASSLRSYAGDTSLPGGKWEHGDKTLEHTARREAFEEIGLPVDRRKVPLLCTLEPFLSGNQLIVTPIVVLVLDKTIQPILNESEVHSLFSHPLISFLSSKPPVASDPDTDDDEYHAYVDINWTGFTDKVRMHRFLTGREAGGTKPIFGLTASILIRVATIGYRLAPEYELTAPGQPSNLERIEYALKNHAVFREASVREGLVKKNHKVNAPSDHIHRENPASSLQPAASRPNSTSKSRIDASPRSGSPTTGSQQDSTKTTPSSSSAPPPQSAGSDGKRSRSRAGEDNPKGDHQRMRGKVRSRL